MTGEEIDAIIEAMVPVCLLCATMVDPTFDKTLCRDCFEHVKEHPRGVRDEHTSANFAMALGLTRGSKKLPAVEFRDEAERLATLDNMLTSLNSHSVFRQHMLRTRFCALYLPAVADALLASRPSERFESFESFVIIVSCFATTEFFVKFFLSDDPRARSGNGTARVIAEQIVVYSPSWHRRDGRSVRAFGGGVNAVSMESACFLLFTIGKVQVDKPSASPISDVLRRKLLVICERWRQIEPTGQGSPIATLRDWLQAGPNELDVARAERDKHEGLFKCGRVGCNQTEDLWLCARCGTATYCGRKHQRDDWHYYGDRMGHQRYCYRPFF